MTLCIGALCREYPPGKLTGKPAVVLCFDKRVETLTAGADIEFKYELLSDKWGALFAGKVALARELTASYKALFKTKPMFEDEELLMALRAPLNSFRDDYADRFVRRKLAMTLDDLKRHGQDRLPEDIYRQTWYEITAQEIDIELILFGWQNGSFRLFKVSFGELYRSEPFAVIGSGTDVAEPALYHRAYRDSWDLPRALYCVYEAQRLGSIAPGVSKEPQSITTVVMYHDDVLERICPKIVREHGTWLEDRFAEFGPREVPELSLPPDTFLDIGEMSRRRKAEREKATEDQPSPS